MIHTANHRFYLRLLTISLFFAVIGLFSVDMRTGTNAQAQRARPKAANAFGESATQQALYSDYKGVRIGMSIDQARSKLGQPTQEFENQDLFVVSETETAQVFFDVQRKITAISIDYLGGLTAPDYKAIVGTSILTKPDGSMYKLVRYEQLGFWVSYNRTAGDLPIITITIQKI